MNTPLGPNLDATHDPQARSFVPVAPDSHFPIQNLPYGIFSPTSGEHPRVGVRIGDLVLDLSVVQDCGLLDSARLPEGIFSAPVLNPFMELEVENRRAVRLLVHGLLREEEPTLRDDATLRARALLPADTVTMHLPVAVRDYTCRWATTAAPAASASPASRWSAPAGRPCRRTRRRPPSAPPG
jgi:fumarylacetoacetase